MNCIITQRREDVGCDIRTASPKKENKGSSSGQGVEQAEGNEVRKCLMLLSDRKHGLRSLAREGQLASVEEMGCAKGTSEPKNLE